MPIYPADIFDTGSVPASAIELRAKLVSAHEVLVRSGHWETLSFAATDDVDNCRQINEAALQWALENAPKRSRERYERVGEPMVMGSDSKMSSGSQWVADQI